MGKIVVGINTKDKSYWKGKMEFIAKLASNKRLNIGMLPSASKHVSIRISDQCINIPNNKVILNVLKGGKKYIRYIQISIT